MNNVFTNVYTPRELKSKLHEAFNALDDILIEHAGPFATNAVIGSKWRQVNDIDEMTKDGIKILRHLIVSEEATARFAARMIRFVGIAVDKRCHDGTTTSMLLFCRLAKAAIKKMDCETHDVERYIWWKEFLSVIEVCLEEIDRLKITEDDILQRATDFGIETTLEDVRAAMGFSMAMISSKGDSDLSEKISTIIRACPEKIYGMFRDIPLAVETEEKYILKKQEFDIAINANLFNMEDYNYKNDTQYLSEDAVIFVSGNEIVSRSFESMFLRAFISENPRLRADLTEFIEDGKGWEAYHQDKRNLIIMSPMVNDPELQADIFEFNKNNPKCKISTFQLQVGGLMKTNLNKTMHFLNGKHLFYDVMNKSVDKCLLGFNPTEDEPSIRVHLLGHVLSITGLYKKTGDVYHPFYTDPEAFEPYTSFRKETEDLIEFCQQNVSNPALDSDELTYLTNLYRALTVQEIFDIEIGGSSHDQYANRTVYEDAMGAALSAVSEGIIMGGYGHLASFARKQITTTKEDSPEFTTMNIWQQFNDHLVSIVSDSIRASDVDYIDTLIDNELKDKWHYIAASPVDYVKSKGSDAAYISVGVFDTDRMKAFLSRDPSNIVLLQAWSGYHEQFRRFRDILPRLANTAHLCDMRIREGEDVR